METTYKVFSAASGLYAGWRLSQTPVARRLMDKIRRNPRVALLSAVVVSGAAVGIWAGRRGKRPLLLRNPISHESAVEGSVEMPAKLPPCQVYLGYPNREGNIEIVGSGFRMAVGERDFLMTASHNLAFDDQLYLIREGQIVNVGSTKNSIQVGTDAAALELPVKVWSTLQASRAKFAPLSRAGSTYVNVVGINGKGTTGKLQPEDVLGCVTYSGTTMGGYSGAPYSNARTVLGMHAYGGKRNGGYSILYLYHLLKIALDISDEAYTKAFFQKLLGNRDPLVTDQYVGDWVIVESQEGYYYRFPKEDYRRYRDEWYEANHRVEEDSDYDDYLYESAVPPNSLRPAHRRAGSSSHASPLEERVEQMSQQMTKLLKLSQQRLSTPAPQLETKSSGRKNTRPRKRQSRPSIGASRSTPNGGGRPSQDIGNPPNVVSTTS